MYKNDIYTTPTAHFSYMNDITRSLLFRLMPNLVHHSVHDAPSLLFRLARSFSSITRSSTQRTEADTLVTWKAELEQLRKAELEATARLGGQWGGASRVPASAATSGF